MLWGGRMWVARAIPTELLSNTKKLWSPGKKGLKEFQLCDSRRLRKKPQDAQDDVTELFDLFDAHFWGWKGIPKAVLPSTHALLLLYLNSSNSVDLAEFHTKKADLRRSAAAQEQLTPVSFASRIAGLPPHNCCWPSSLHLFCLSHFSLYIPVPVSRVTLSGCFLGLGPVHGFGRPHCYPRATTREGQPGNKPKETNEFRVNLPKSEKVRGHLGIQSSP